MKTKHLLMAGLGLISFVGMSLSSVQKAFGQARIIQDTQGKHDRIVQDSQGRFYLEVWGGYSPPYIRCTRDAQYCFHVFDPIPCPQGTCYPLSLINEKTVFHNPYYADFCWKNYSDALTDSVIEAIDCGIYGALRRGSGMRRGGTRLEDAIDRLREQLDRIR